MINGMINRDEFENHYHYLFELLQKCNPPERMLILMGMELDFEGKSVAWRGWDYPDWWAGEYFICDPTPEMIEQFRKFNEPFCGRGAA